VAQAGRLTYLVQIYSKVGYAREGLALLNEAQAIVHATGGRMDEAELHRLRGELLLQVSSDQSVEAETYFHQALDIAHRQEAKSWELRAAMSLARLWQQQGKRDEARERLAPIYDWFTEGFDTGDLQEATYLLDELST
jgi:predicted ATPase